VDFNTNLQKNPIFHVKLRVFSYPEAIWLRKWFDSQKSVDLDFTPPPECVKWAFEVGDG